MSVFEVIRTDWRSKYAVDTRRMIVTDRVRQGVCEWPQSSNYPNKELLGRYDLYSQPSGRESQKAAYLREELPPTDPPKCQVLYPQSSACGIRLSKKTNTSGVESRKAEAQSKQISKKSGTSGCAGSKRAG